MTHLRHSNVAADRLARRVDSAFPSDMACRGHRNAATDRRGFTLIELMVTISIIAVVIGIVFVSLGETLSQAEEQKNKVGLSVVDSALQSRLEAFGDLVQRAEMGQPTGPLYLDVELRAQNLLAGYNADGGNTPASIDFNQARTFVLHELYRGLFPQRLEDMFGMDGVPAPLSSGDVSLRVNDDSPLLSLYAESHSGFVDAGGGTNGALLSLANGYNDWADGSGSAGDADYDAYVEELESGTTSSELLVLFLTSQLGLSATPISVGELGELAVDSDGDGLIELRDTEGRPIIFFNAPTRLVRPNGEDASNNYQPFSITPLQAANARRMINSLPKFDAGAYPDNIEKAGALPSTNYEPSSGVKRSTASHPLNTDPYDRLRLLDGVFLRDNPINVVLYFGARNADNSARTIAISPFSEKFYWTRNTYFTPLVLSAGADGEYGFQLPHTSRRINNTTGAIEEADPNVATDPIATTARLGYFAVGDLSEISDNITNRKRVLK